MLHEKHYTKYFPRVIFCNLVATKWICSACLILAVFEGFPIYNYAYQEPVEKITCDTKHMAAVTGEWVRGTQTKIWFSFSVLPFLDYDEAQYQSLKLNVYEKKTQKRKTEDCVLSEMQVMRENPSLCCIIVGFFYFYFFCWYWIASAKITIDLLGVWFEHESGSSQCMYMCSCFQSKNLLIIGSAAEFIFCSLFSCLPMFSVHLAFLRAKLNQHNHSLGYISMVSNDNINNVQHIVINSMSEWKLKCMPLLWLYAS